MINIIFAVDRKNNFCSTDRVSLPWGTIKEDMTHFKTITMSYPNNSVIMGKKTFESIGHKPLKDRVNIIVSKTLLNTPPYPENVSITSSLNEAINEAKELQCPNIFIIGGISLIEEALQRNDISNIYITVVNVICDYGIQYNYKLPSSFRIWEERHTNDCSYYTYIRKTGEEEYINLVKDVLTKGESRDDRTGVGTIGLFGKHFTMDISNSFPLLTSKRVWWKGVLEELLFFISGSTDTKILEDKGVNIWKGNTSREFLDKRGLHDLKEGEYGKSYGYQWRKFGDKVDQLQTLIDGIKNDPFSRRHYMTAWNPLELDNIPLPACHLSCQFYVSSDNKKLSCQVYMRSCDVFLGLPFNIASYACLTYMICHLTNLQPHTLSFCLGDTHIYKNHISQCEEMVKRTLRELPKLVVKGGEAGKRKVENIDDFKAEDFEIIGYNPHPTIKAEMAV
jgi:thymidylate synthase